MNKNLSSYLNFARWAAAFFVVISHVRQIVFVDFGLVQEKTLIIKALYLLTGLGHEAVVIFFVTSGYLVGAVTWGRWKTSGVDVREYIIARVSRIYVVLIPALIIGLALDLIGMYWINSSELYTNSGKYFALSLGNTSELTMNAKTFLGNLLMLEGVLVSYLGSNGTLWSLVYEWWYYCIFALIAAAIIDKRRLGFRLLYAILAGVIVIWLPAKIVLWGAVWMLGFLAYEWLRLDALKPPPIFGLSMLIASLIFSRISRTNSGLDPLYLEFTRDFCVGISFVAWMVSTGRIKRPMRWVGVHAKFAGFSYSIYLFHFPAMLFVVAAGFQYFGLLFKMQPSLFGVGYLVGVVLLLYIYCFALSELTEKYTGAVRVKISSLLFGSHLAHVCQEKK